MSSPQKLILLNGPAGIGKTTISKMYLTEHPLALSIEGDQIIGMMGHWREHESIARELVFKHTKCMAEVHLKEGLDVLLPYLLTNADHATAFERIAEENGALFCEIILLADKDEATNRLLERGVWGEEGSKKLTEKQRPEIESLYDGMMAALAKRPNTVRIGVEKDDIAGTYAKFLKAVSGQ